MKLYIACPAYDGKASDKTLESLCDTLAMVPSDIELVDFDYEIGCCYLPIARNKLVKRFMDSSADTFLFLDADISWPFPKQFINFLKTDQEVVAGLYRFKQWDAGFPCHIYCDDSGRPVVKDGLILAEGVPTGCLKIQRKAFERMIKYYGESLEVDTPDQSTLEPKFAYYNFFDTEKVGRTWIGEDYNFCRYYIRSGGQIWVYPDITLDHHGSVFIYDKQGNMVMKTHSFTGNYHDFLSRCPGGCNAGEVNGDDYQGNDIDGWMTLAELRFLYQESSKYESVVEIGSFKGRSTHALLSGLVDKVICVDPWNYNSEAENIFSGEKEYKSFLKNVESFQCNGRLQVIREMSEKAIDAIDKVDMVFIDGDHHYEAVKKDIELYLPKTNKLICGHDYGDFPGVIKAVKEKFGDSFKLIDSIWYVNL